MATVKIDKFHGIQPRVHPSLLADGMATEAFNCRLKNGKLVPIREPKIVSGKKMYFEAGLTRVADAKSVYGWRHGSLSGERVLEFLLFPGEVYFARSNIADDKYDRLFVSGETGVSWTDGDGVTHENVPCVYLYDIENDAVIRHPMCKSALPCPNVHNMETVDENKTVYFTYFFYTYVDQFGYEGPLSLPSTVDGVETMLRYNDGNTIRFDAVTLPDEAVTLRVYKVVTGSEVGNIQFVKDISKEDAASQFTISVRDEEAGEIYQTLESPETDLKSVMNVPGGFLVGFSPSHPYTVTFSEVGIPTSWPSAYKYDVENRIVGLAVTSNCVFVLTDGEPFVLMGTDPNSMTVSKLGSPAACASNRGIVVYQNCVFYVGFSGLMMLADGSGAGTAAKNIVDKIFTRDQWLAYNPTSCIMGQYDGALRLFFTLADGTPKGLNVDLTETEDSVTEHNEVAQCAFVDAAENKLYYVRG